MCEGTRLFSSFTFWLDKGTLRCGDNFWSDFLHLIVLVVKAFQCQETQLSRYRNMQQEQRSLTICWMTWMVLQPFSSFAKHGLHGFKPKKFDLVHRTVFLVRDVVWARDYTRPVPKSSLPPVVDCLQYADTEREGQGDLITCSWSVCH